MSEIDIFYFREKMSKTTLSIFEKIEYSKKLSEIDIVYFREQMSKNDIINF